MEEDNLAAAKSHKGYTVRSYDVNFKLGVIDFAKKHSNREAEPYVGMEMNRRFPESFESTDLLRSRWKMLVQRAKKQYTEFKTGTRRTGGGGIRRPEEWASKICTEVLPTEVIFGIPGGVDMGQPVMAHHPNDMVIAEPFVDDRGPQQLDYDEEEDLERERESDRYDDDAAEEVNLGHRAAGFIQNEMIESGRQCCSAPPAAYYLNVGQNPPPVFRNKRKMSATSCWELAVTAEEKKFEAETEKLKVEKDFFLAKTKYYKLQCETLERELSGDE